MEKVKRWIVYLPRDTIHDETITNILGGALVRDVI